MPRLPQGSFTATESASPFALPPARPRLRAAREPREGLLTMLVVAFLLASPVITLLLALS